MRIDSGTSPAKDNASAISVVVLGRRDSDFGKNKTLTQMEESCLLRVGKRNVVMVLVVDMDTWVGSASFGSSVYGYRNSRFKML